MLHPCHADHTPSTQAMLAREIDEDLGVDSLTLAEVLVAPARKNRLQVVRTMLAELEVQELPFPEDTAIKLARLRAATGLKMPDCCVLLAAEHHDARLASFDERLTEVATRCSLKTVAR